MFKQEQEKYKEIIQTLVALQRTQKILI